MCLINFAFKQNEKYPFILVGNRDEFYQRPTHQLHWWEDMPEILAGRDLKDGGTWMGITKEGKFATLTNYRDPKNINQDAPSRGNLVTKYLSGELSLENFHNYLKNEGAKYNGFNLVYGTMENLFYYANKDNRWSALAPGVYGLSNAFLDTPWRKTVISKSNFQKLIDTQLMDEEKLIAILSDKSFASDDALPETGVPYDIEKKVSAMFIEMEYYGTRLTSSIVVDNKGNVRFTEKSFVPPSYQHFTFTIK